MSFPRYSKYKASGVEWLGEVPEHWDLIQARRLFTQEREPARSSDDQLSATQKYGVIPQKLFMEMEDQKVTLALSGLDNFKHVEKGDFVISLRSFQGGIEYSAYPGCVSPAYTVLRPVDSIVGQFWSYLLKSKGYIETLQSVTDGIRDGKNISYQQFGQIVVPVIKVAEQTAIAEFLDRETAKIDGLVAEQRRLMELLKEKRQAVISHAVTKGLNPHAPMKPSGIEWLGEVPEHWEVKRFKRIAELIDGDRSSAYPSDQDIVEEGIPFLSSKNIVGYKFRDIDLRFITQEKFDYLSRGKIRDNDLAITVRGTIGHVAIYDAKLLGHPTAFINAQMMIIRPKEVTASFIHSISESHYWQKQLDVASYGTAQQQLSNAILQNILVAVPPAKDLEDICSFLATETAKFDTLITEAQRAIDLLQERRTALISAAVTGQIDIRGVA